MQVLNSFYLVDEKIPKENNFIISASFKRELKRNVKRELESYFRSNLNLSKIFLRFYTSGGFFSKAKMKEELFLKASKEKKNESFAENFLVGYNGAYEHTPKLIVENLAGDWPILDPTEEVLPNSLKMRLEFDKPDFESLQNFAEIEAKNKYGTKLEGYKYEVWAKDLNVDVVFTLYFSDENYNLENFLILIGGIISEYNENSEKQTHSPILIEPDLSKYKKKVYDPAQNTITWRSIYRYDEITDENRKKEIDKLIIDTIESQLRAVEEFNKNLEEPPKLHYILPTGLIHSFDLIKHDKKKRIVNIKVDLGSSSHGFEYILKGINNSVDEISKIEVKGL